MKRQILRNLQEAKFEKDFDPWEKEDIRNARLFGSTKNRDNKTGFRREVSQLQRGIKKLTPESDRRKSIVFEPYDDPIHVKAKLGKMRPKRARRMRLKRAANNIVPFREDYLYDLILEYLLYEGYADCLGSAEIILENMSDEWLDYIIG